MSLFTSRIRSSTSHVGTRTGHKSVSNILRCSLTTGAASWMNWRACQSAIDQLSPMLRPILPRVNLVWIWL